MQSRYEMMVDSRIALLFPGQGCQFVGMGQELYKESSKARVLFEQADEILGFALSEICFLGPEDVLGDTANTQPAIYLVTMALWQLLEPRLEPIRDRIACVAGHSLGEYSALTAAGALSFEDGLRLVRQRGEAMRDAGSEAPGGMGVIIGLDDETVYGIVESTGSGVWVANLNSPGQVVIAGENEPLQRALALAKEHKARRALPLAVSVACHTPLMAAAAERLGVALENTPFSEPWAPVVSNVSAEPLSEPDQIQAALIEQLSSPVRWVESVRTMVQNGVTRGIEVGPKVVVSGLIKRIDRSLKMQGVVDYSAVEVFDAEGL